MPIQSGLPIMPGPFSFLQSAGEAAGAIGSQIEERRDKRRAEAQQKANNFLALRAAGLMSPEEFSRPEVQQVFDAAGFGIPSSTPTSGERVESIRRRATSPDRPEMTIPIGDLMSGLMGTAVPAPPTRVPASGPSSVTDEERAIAGLPSRSSIGKERIDQARVGEQEKIIASGPAAQRRAVLGTPSPVTAQAAEDAANDQLFNSLALRAVDAAVTQSGGRIKPDQLMGLAENAWALAQEDAKMRGYVADEQFTKPYIMAVISSRLREQRMQDISAAAASNRSANTYQDYITLLRDQVRLAQQQLIALPKPSVDETRYAALYERKLRQASTPAERSAVENNTMLKTAYDKVQMYNQTAARLTAEIDGYQAQLQSGLSRVLPGVTTTPPSSEATTLNEDQINTIVQRMDADPQYAQLPAAEAAVRQAVQAGEMSQSDADRVLSRLRQRRQPAEFRGPSAPTRPTVRSQAASAAGITTTTTPGATP